MKAKTAKPKLTVDEAVAAVRVATKAHVLAKFRLGKADAEAAQAETELRAASVRLARARKALNEAMQ